MNVDNPMSFSANIIALVALIFKTVFDLLINPVLFKKNLKMYETILSARLKRRRADITTTITFSVLVISYGLFILEAII